MQKNTTVFGISCHDECHISSLYCVKLSKGELFWNDSCVPISHTEITIGTSITLDNSYSII